MCATKITTDDTETDSAGAARDNRAPHPYRPRELERQAQEFWRRNSSFRARQDPQREKFYCLSMFPYPSGQLHMGHVRNYVIGDAISRYQGMLGKNVLQPMGWDAFGLPAENAAIEHNKSPADWTYANIKTMRSQLRRLGLAYDWRREITTCRPDYYRWEQWFFIRLFAKGLIYRKDAWVNWDPVDKTVLANEQVIDGKGWRSGAAVERRKAPQWFLKTTHYAEELWSGLEDLRAGWPKQVIKMQKAWIGKSHGVEIQFALQGRAQSLSVFTTRPDTLMGVSCIALSPEHPLVVELMKEREDLRDFVAAYKKCPTAESESARREKTGLDTGLRCVHPLSGAVLPVWCADFVLMEYGSGAVMSVPAHDQRDWLFAQRYSLPWRAVIYPADGEPHDFQRGAYTGAGILRNAGAYDGMPSSQGGEAIVRDLETKRRAQRVTQYRLRDWGISRQRYWGCPIPMVYVGDECRPAPEEDLPRVLDESMRAWRERRRAQAQSADDENSRAPRDDGEPRYETDTLDTFFESSWYYARFAGICDKKIFSEEVDYWLPVDQYVGGIEHAVLHLLYARLFHKIMRDFGLLKGDEPFMRLLAQGMVLKDGQKMSKSRNNTVNPERLIDRYGADTIRLFVLFAAPPEQALEWSESGVEGAFRFLKRLWKAVFDHCRRERTEPSRPRSERAQCRALRHEIHATIAKVSDDLGRRYTFNTAIAALMKLMNSINRFDDDSQRGRDLRREGLSALVMMLSPMVPHITHSLWFALGHKKALVECRWPLADPQALSVDSREIAVQVNGKLRGRLSMPSGSEQSAIQAAVMADKRLASFIAPHTIRRLIVVPDRLINFVLD